MYPLESEVSAQVSASGHHIIVESLVKKVVFPHKEPQSRLGTLGRGGAEPRPGADTAGEHTSPRLPACGQLPGSSSELLSDRSMGYPR